MIEPVELVQQDQESTIEVNRPDKDQDEEEEKEEFTIRINRNHFDQRKYSEHFKTRPLVIHNLFTSFKNYSKKYFKPTKSCGLQFLLELFPVINLVQTYKLKYVLRDTIGGITIGAMQIAPSKRESLYFCTKKSQLSRA
jgi:hypothetical protein